MTNVKVTPLNLKYRTPKNPNPPIHISFTLGKPLLGEVDRLVRNGVFVSRADFMREATRDLVNFYSSRGSKTEKLRVEKQRKTT